MECLFQLGRVCEPLKGRKDENTRRREDMEGWQKMTRDLPCRPGCSLGNIHGWMGWESQRLERGILACDLGFGERRGPPLWIWGMGHGAGRGSLLPPLRSVTVAEEDRMAREGNGVG